VKPKRIGQRSDDEALSASAKTLKPVDRATFSTKPQGGGTFDVNGQETRAAELKVGQQITLWVPESRIGSESAAYADRGFLAGNRTALSNSDSAICCKAQEYARRLLLIVLM
jgi:hypothetical protein